MIGPDGDAADPTLTADQLTVYFVGNGILYTEHRTSTASPWGVPMVVGFAGMSANERITLPKVSADGTRMFLSIVDMTTNVDQLVYSTKNTATTDWTAPVPVVSDELATLRLTSASFGPNDRVIVSGEQTGNFDRDLYEGTFDPNSAPQVTIARALALDTPFAEEAPSLSADGLQLYFQSDASTVTAPWVASRKTVDDEFTTAVRLDELEGGTPLDGAPWVSTGQRTIYFTHRPTTGPIRIWTATRTTF